jgi:SAM-dependent methyltransferase
VPLESSLVAEWDDTDYGPVAQSYAGIRRADPLIAAQILEALGDARTVINVGAGTGSYEPVDRYVVAVEPVADMRARRLPTSVPAIDARADALPYDDDSFDAGLAVFTVHHWPDLAAGLAEMRRVCRTRIVVVTADPEALSTLWIASYSPEFHAVERRRYPSLDQLARLLGGGVEVRSMIVPLECSDGFADAFYGRPEELLRTEVRQAQSAWSFVSEADQERFLARLSADLASGAWDAQYGHLRTLPETETSIRLLIATRI